MEESKPASKEIALACLLTICADPEVRPADRLTAAKMLLELEEDQDSKLTVVMEGIPDSYLV